MANGIPTMTFLKDSAFLKGFRLLPRGRNRSLSLGTNCLLSGKSSTFGKQVARFGGENFFCFWEASRPLPLIYAERNALTPVSAKRRGSSVFTPFPPSEKEIAFVLPAAPTGNFLQAAPQKRRIPFLTKLYPLFLSLSRKYRNFTFSG